MQSGAIKWFNVDKGFGFLKPDDGSRDVFVHITSLKRSRVDGELDEGDRLLFETEEGPKGLRAINLSRTG